jgi:hypothetical protein
MFHLLLGEFWNSWFCLLFNKIVIFCNTTTHVRSQHMCLCFLCLGFKFQWLKINVILLRMWVEFMKIQTL